VFERRIASGPCQAVTRSPWSLSRIASGGGEEAELRDGGGDGELKILDEALVPADPVEAALGRLSARADPLRGRGVPRHQPGRPFGP
jgi:hypothetical protein